MLSCRKPFALSHHSMNGWVCLPLTKKATHSSFTDSPANSCLYETLLRLHWQTGCNHSLCICLHLRMYLLGLCLHLIQRWKVRKVFLQSLYALLFFLVLFALSLTLLFQTIDVAIPCPYLWTTNNTTHWFHNIMLNNLSFKWQKWPIFLFMWSFVDRIVLSSAQHFSFTFSVLIIVNSVLVICCTFSSSFLTSSVYFCVTCLKISFKWSTSSSATASFLPMFSSQHSLSDDCLHGVLIPDSYWTTRACAVTFIM